MRTTNKLLIAAFAVTTIVSCHKDKDALNDTDKNFLKMASYGNHAEVDAGSVAATRAQDSAVKSFGSFMVTEHTTAQQDLQNLAASKKIDIPGEADDAHKAMKDQLLKLNGKAFDSTYIHGQLTDHQNVLNLFKNEQSNGKNQDVKDYANKYIGHIQMHYNKADSLVKKF